MAGYYIALANRSGISLCCVRFGAPQLVQVRVGERTKATSARLSEPGEKRPGLADSCALGQISQQPMAIRRLVGMTGRIFR
jgi:hypothetical protein